MTWSSRNAIGLETTVHKDVDQGQLIDAITTSEAQLTICLAPAEEACHNPRGTSGPNPKQPRGRPRMTERARPARPPGNTRG
jgi:hypothetical protein